MDDCEILERKYIALGKELSICRYPLDPERAENLKNFFRNDIPIAYAFSLELTYSPWERERRTTVRRASWFMGLEGFRQLFNEIKNERDYDKAYLFLLKLGRKEGLNSLEDYFEFAKS